jgi:uncharacterized protein (DUF488 family)
VTLFTIGHSNRSEEAFLDLLEAHGVEMIVDIRHYPRSRHNPQYDADALKAWLNTAGVAYEHVSLLGGRRHGHFGQPPEVNAGWENASFQAYADYALSAEFARGLEQLISLAELRPVAVMCAEAVPWRCHRSIISDWLVRGHEVKHIMSADKVTPHHLGAWGAKPQVENGQVTYPATGATC